MGGVGAYAFASMKRGVRLGGLVVVASVVFYIAAVAVTGTVNAVTRPSADKASGARADAGNVANSRRLFVRGRRIFRFDTFGDQSFWGGQLRLHDAIKGRRLGGVGAGISPKTALALGLKVDAAAIPKNVAAAIKAGKVNLNDPKVTVDLLKLNAVVGLRGFFNRRGNLNSVGITCAVCHSTVDDSFAPGIGRRLDGWANRDLNVGAIVASVPNPKPLTDLLRVDAATLKKVLMSWGPGKFDAELNHDGKAFRPDGKPAATLLPPAFGLAGVNLHTWTGGWGTVTYWNAYVANTQMFGIGNFFDPRLNDPDKYPVAARSGRFNIRHGRDLITSKLPALQVYQLALPAPKPPKGSFAPRAAARGRAVFTGKGKCANCHVPPAFVEPGWPTHKPSEICTDAFQANRSPEGTYRTAPLRGLWTHQKGGFYHDGRFANLRAVVDHYDACFNLGLTPLEKSDLVQYLRSQ